MEGVSNSNNLSPEIKSKSLEGHDEAQSEVSIKLQQLAEEILIAKGPAKLIPRKKARNAAIIHAKDITEIFKRTLAEGNVEEAQAINQSLLEKFQGASTEAMFGNLHPFTQAEFESNQKEIDQVSKYQQIMKKSHVFRLKPGAKIRTLEDLQKYPEIPNPPPSNILLIDDSKKYTINLFYKKAEKESFKLITTNFKDLGMDIQAHEEKIHADQQKFEKIFAEEYNVILFAGSGVPTSDDFKNDKDILFRMDWTTTPSEIEIFVKDRATGEIESKKYPSDNVDECKAYMDDFLEAFPLSSKEIFEIPNVQKFTYNKDFNDNDFIDFCKKNNLPADTVLVDNSDPNNYIVLAYDVCEGKLCEYFDVSPFEIKDTIEDAKNEYLKAYSNLDAGSKKLGMGSLVYNKTPDLHRFQEVDSLFFNFDTSTLPIKASIFSKSSTSQSVDKLEIEVTTLKNMKDSVQDIRTRIFNDKKVEWKEKGLFTENFSPSPLNFYPTADHFVKIFPSKEHGELVIATFNPQSSKITHETINISSPDFKISDLERKLESANKEMEALLNSEQLYENIKKKGIPVIDHPPSQEELNNHDFLLITQPPYLQFQVVFLDLIDGSTITRETTWNRVETTILDVQKHLEYEKNSGKKPPSLQESLLKLQQSHSLLKGINPEEMAKVADSCASCVQYTLTPSSRQSRKVSEMKATVVSGDNKDYVILPKELKGKKFAHGAYKAASVAAGIQDRTTYAWATTELSTDSLKNSTVREINVQKELQKITTPESKYLLKPRLVAEYKSSKQTDKVGIITEFCDIGEFDQISRYPVKKQLELFKEALQGVKALHDNEIIHCDLKPENIFLKTNEKGEPEARVADFGLSYIPSEQGAQGRGTPVYVPLEIYNSQTINTKSSDIYAMGVIAHRALLGKIPSAQYTNNNKELIDRLADRDKNNESVADIKKEDLAKSSFLQLVYDMMYPTENNRPQSIDKAISRLDQVLTNPDEIAFLEQYINP